VRPEAMIDIHSHILPQIDDGAKSLQEAIEMARIAVSDGIEQMVCTPHMFNGISRNPEPKEVFDRVSALQEAVGTEGLRVLPGNEVHMTHQIVQQACNNRVMRLNRQNYMLVEFPAMTVPAAAGDLFRQLQSNGVLPILVHPERNVQLQGHPSLVAEFVESGVYVQVTGMSLTGEFGRAAKNCAESLLRHNCVHFLATDAHRADRRPPILSRGRDAAAEIIGVDNAQKLVYDNPLAAINGDPLQVDPPISYSRRFQGSASFFGKLFGR
jgi:protein-tyrosine phosphatase